jgi:zinc protease
VARRYLDHRRMSAVALLPKGAAYDTKDLVAAAAELLAPHADKATQAAARSRKRARGSADAPEPARETIQLPSGARVLYVERPQSHVFSIHAAALGGLRLELAHPVESAERDWGASHMMSLTWAKGTPTRDARQIAREVEGRAASVEGFSGRNTVGVQATGLARDWELLSGLLAEVLLEPAFPESEVDHSRRVAEDSVRGIEDHSSQLCSRLFLETLFERHPYGRMTVGSLESLPHINGEKLRAFHRAWIRPERLVITVCGAVRRSYLEQWLGDLDGRLARIGAAAGPGGAPSSLPDEPALKAPRWAEKALGREQTHILVGGLGTRVMEEDRHALRLLQTLLGGQSGRLFIELREKRSLAYTVSPLSFEGLERGYVGTYIACAPAKREEAIAGIRGVLEAFAAKGAGKAEMERAKEFLLGRRAMDLQSDGSLAAHHGLEALYGMARLSEAELSRKVRALTSRDLQAACRKYLVEPPMVTSIVG